MVSRASERFLGLELGHRYTITESLAEGACALVLRGEDTVLRRPVAVKVIPVTQGDAYRSALRQTASLSHPALIAIYDVLEHEDTLCIVEEYVPAYPLASYLRQGVPTERALALGVQLMHALAYVHRHGVVHGDLVPSSVLVDRRAVVRVNNCALPRDAAWFDEAIKEVVSSSGGFVAAGLDGSEDVEAVVRQLGNETSMASDVWAVGVLIWRLLAETSATSGKDSRPTDVARETGARVIRPDVPEDVQRFLARWLVGRAGDADAVASHLEELGVELTRQRGESSVLTPPALRAARDVAARNAAWSVSETLSGPRLWQGERHPGLTAMAEPSAPTDPMTRTENNQRRLDYPVPVGGPNYDVVLDQRRASPVMMAEPTPQWEVSAIRTTDIADMSATAHTAPNRRPGPGLGGVLVVGMVLFVLFFLIGYFGPLLFSAH